MHRFTRQELYELVWAEPKTSLAKRLGISDVGLAKACAKANIPIPDRGYWAKKQFGKATIQPPLPKRGLGQRDDVLIGSRYYRDCAISDAELMATEAEPPPRFAEALEEIRKRAEAMVAKVHIAKTLGRVHPAIGKLLQEDETRREKLKVNGYSWDLPVFETPFEKRRLKILNSLCLALASCGCSLSVRGNYARELHATTNDTGLSFTLDDVAAKPSPSHVPPRASDAKARMRLRIERSWPLTDETLEWEDTAASRLEDQIGEIAAGFLIAGEWAYRDWCARVHKWDVERRRELLEKARREKAEAERKEAARIRKIEQDRRDSLVAETGAWRQAAGIRSYVEAVIGSAKRGGGDGLPELEAWVVWALAEADRIDPLKGARSTRIEASMEDVPSAD